MIRQQIRVEQSPFLLFILFAVRRAPKPDVNRSQSKNENKF